MIKRTFYILSSAIILMGCNMDKQTIHAEIGMSAEEFNKQEAVGTILSSLGVDRPSLTGSDKPHNVIYTYKGKSIVIDADGDISQTYIASSAIDHRSMDLLERSEIDSISIIIGRNKIGSNIFSRKYIDIDSALTISQELCDKFESLGFKGIDGKKLRDFKIYGKSGLVAGQPKKHISNLKIFKEMILDEGNGGVNFTYCRGEIESEAIGLQIKIIDLQREYKHISLIDENEKNRYSIRIRVFKDNSELVEKIQQEIKRKKETNNNG